MPSLIQLAFGGEAVVQIISGCLLLLYPAETYNFLARKTVPGVDPASTAPAFALELVQILGIFLFQITIPLVMGLPDGPQAYHWRVLTYYVLGGAEVLLIPFLAWKGFSDSGGIDSGIALQLAGGMVPFLAFRLWILYARPDLLRAKAAFGKNQ